MEYHCFLLLLRLSKCEQFHSLRTYRTSVFPLSLYRIESSIGERTLYKTLLLIRIFRKTVRQEQIQDTKSTRNRTSVFTTELNERVHESKQCIGLYSFSVYLYRTESSIGQLFLERLCSPVEPLEQIQC